jgi:hypothetical protein
VVVALHPHRQDVFVVVLHHRGVVARTYHDVVAFGRQVGDDGG